MRYAFIKVHRPRFHVRTMCRMLCVHPSGFYAWLKRPFSKRAVEDKRQTELLKGAWEDSGKVYGYRKLHDDLLDQGETCCPNRVARLARMAGIKAQIGYKRRVGKYGGRPQSLSTTRWTGSLKSLVQTAFGSPILLISKPTRGLHIWRL